MKKKKTLSKRERKFCSLFVNSGDIEKSAYFAGYEKSPLVEGEKLLGRSDVTDEIARLTELRNQSMSQLADIGYQRLAFGSIADAVKLLFIENPTEKQIDEMNLFSVAEIKRPKDGAMEIKFFDRLKALEKLSTGSTQNSAAGFLEALTLGAKAVCSNGDEQNEV